MYDYSFLKDLLAIDPAYVGVLAGLAVLLTQSTKQLVPKIKSYAQSIVLAWGIFLAVLPPKFISILVIAYLITAAAAGSYSLVKGREEEEEQLTAEQLADKMVKEGGKVISTDRRS